MTTYKSCSCCGRSYTRGQWLGLAMVGRQKYPWGDEIEMRNCACKSTLGIYVKRGPERDPDFDALSRRVLYGGRKARSAKRRLRAHFGETAIDDAVCRAIEGAAYRAMKRGSE